MSPVPPYADPLGDRLKRDYEDRTRYYLPRRTYTLLRVDGKTFHTYTKGCERPFDSGLMADMDAAALGLCGAIEGAKFAFVQSDEISVLLADFGDSHTEAWFNNNLQKITSVAASVVTAHFNRAQARRGVQEEKIAYFDCRVWTIPSRADVLDYFVWRQNDATRNSISMTARAHFPHESLQGKRSAHLQEMLWQECGVNWNDMPAGFKRGRIVESVRTVEDIAYTDRRDGKDYIAEGVVRHSWVINEEPPIFAQDREWLNARIPRQDIPG